MKFVLILLMLPTLIILGCNKNNNSNTIQSITKDSSLLFSLSVTDKISDTSIYQNQVNVIYSPYLVVIDGPDKCIDFADKYSTGNAVPNVSVTLPADKLNNNLTIYVEAKNSPANTSTGLLNNFWDSTSYYLATVIGNSPAQTEGTFRLQIEHDVKPAFIYYHIAEWTSPGQNCGGLGFANSFAFSNPVDFGLVNYTKLAVTINNNAVIAYFNGVPVFSNSSTVVDIKKCMSNIFKLESARGTMLKKLKIYNRTLSVEELSKL